MPTTALIRKIADLDPSLREVILLLLEEVERQREQLSQQVTKTEFNELKAAVEELVEAQKRTEEQVNQLAEAQRRTEERLSRLEVVVAELAEAQKRTEERVNQLAEAQRRTEERLSRLEVVVAELAEAQKRTEERVNQLAEAQKRTEEELKKLVAEHKITRERLEGISNSVGYTLEDRAFRSLPAVLREHGFEVEGRLVRKYVLVRGRERQVNIYGHGKREGKPVFIVGEAKVRPSRKEIDRFVRLVRQLETQEGKEAAMVFVAYDFPPSVENYLREKGILPIWSYDLAL